MQLNAPPSGPPDGTGGSGGGGQASSYYQSGTDAHPNEQRYAAEARQATNGITGQGDSSRGMDGERGFMGDMAKNALMQKLGLKPAKTSVRFLTACDQGVS